jgi:hypothetical protein
MDAAADAARANRGPAVLAALTRRIVRPIWPQRSKSFTSRPAGLRERWHLLGPPHRRSDRTLIEVPLMIGLVDSFVDATEAFRRFTRYRRDH